MHLNLNFKSLALLLMSGLLATFPARAGNINITYDQQQGRIQIQVSNASLTAVLAEIASKTNMIIQIDPAVEKQVSFNLRPQPLQQALQKVVKGLSYVIEYKTDAQQKTVVSGMRLLPKGKQDSGQLVPVSVLNARAGRSGGGSSDYDGSINRRGNYYPGSRRSSPNPQVQRPTNNMQGGVDGNDMLVQDGVVDTVRQQTKPQAKKTRPKAPHPDLP